MTTSGARATCAPKAPRSEAFITIRTACALPMVRDGDEWREVTWDEAFARCEELLAPDRRRSTGSPPSPPTSAIRPSTTTRSAATPGPSRGSRGCRSIWSAGTVDQWPKNLACAQLFGNPWSIPIPDVQRTDLFVVMGANPHASQGSLFSCPDIMGEIKRIRERGGRTIVVDPRRTGTAERPTSGSRSSPAWTRPSCSPIVNVLDAEGLV